MNSVLVAEHHKILEADILWEMCVCVIVDYIIIHPPFACPLIFSQTESVLHFLNFKFTFTDLMWSKYLLCMGYIFF